jgi:hypothetical protein
MMKLLEKVSRVQLYAKQGTSNNENENFLATFSIRTQYPIAWLSAEWFGRCNTVTDRYVQ